jgi:hypothetical protein
MRYGRITREARRYSEIEILRDPISKLTVTAMATANLVDGSGACGVNQGGFTNIADQRRCWQAAGRGLVQSDSSWITKANLAITYGFDNQDVDGSFLGTSDAFDTLGFLEAVIRVERLFRLNGQSLASIDGIKTKFSSALAWLDGPSKTEFASQWAVVFSYMNALSGLIVLYDLGGDWLGNQLYRSKANTMRLEMASYQNPAGWYAEAGGTDSGYQTVSLWHLAIGLIYTPDTALETSAKLGWTWERTKLNANGSLNLTGNTRVLVDASVNYPEAVLAMKYGEYVLGQSDLGIRANSTYEYAS